MNKSKRLVDLIMVINAKRQFTAKELAEEMDVSIRTIQRDLLDLQELGVPIYSQPGVGGGYRILKEKILPPISFTEDEAISMFFANQSLQFYQDLPFDTDAKQALNKFHHYLSNDIKKKIEQLKKRFVFYTHERHRKSPFLRLLLETSINQRVLEVTYESVTETTKRNIQPIGIFARNGFWYCPSYCFNKQEVRLFRVDRFLSVDVSHEIEPVDLNGYTIENWFSSFSKSEELHLNVRLTREGVKVCENDPYLETKLTIHENGTGILKTDVSSKNLDYFANFFLSLGTHAKIREPQELINVMKEKINELNRMYGS
ncbi:YafY family protein [Bacillus carboniphilus]|uniref:YafY family protein n=1 Tax=Bacillus carboniphilus TaxID=86663 RepID=A0ABY9JYL7_9BACI|nr:YafY family protein [Bacillus carboniphilus]WLR42721.1 YafY family protein [Bacillus carboniphilus]